MYSFIKNKVITFYKDMKESRANDPVRHCNIHRRFGCSHVDGPLCHLKSCDVEVQVENLNTHRIEIYKPTEVLK
jgi:hypothetical protein